MMKGSIKKGSKDFLFFFKKKPLCLHWQHRRGVKLTNEEISGHLAKIIHCYFIVSMYKRKAITKPRFIWLFSIVSCSMKYWKHLTLQPNCFLLAFLSDRIAQE